MASPRLSLPRDSRFSTLQIILAYAGRFSDELMGGLPDVLMPTIQQQLGLSLAQVTGLTNAMLIVFLPAVIVMGWLVLRL